MTNAARSKSARSFHTPGHCVDISGRRHTPVRRNSNDMDELADIFGDRLVRPIGLLGEKPGEFLQRRSGRGRINGIESVEKRTMVDYDRGQRAQRSAVSGAPFGGTCPKSGEDWDDGLFVHGAVDKGIFPHQSTGIFPLAEDLSSRDNARVSDPREILLERIAERCAALGITPRDLSMRATGKPDVVRDMKRRKSLPNASTLAAIAQELETTTDWLLGRTANPVQPTSEIGFPDLDLSTEKSNISRMPVYGTGYCDDLEVTVDGNVAHIEQTLFEPSVVLHMITRPAALNGAKDAYGIYFHGSSMEPRFLQGEIGIVVTNPPPGPGDFVVVQLNDGNGDDVVHVLVKQLVRVTSASVELRQFNPDMVFTFERRRITRMHRIAMHGDPAWFR